MERMLKYLTILLMSLTPVIWIVWDVFVGNKGSETESRLLSNAANVTVAFPFIIGFWLGHLFANRSNVGSSSILNGLPVFIILIIFDIIWNVAYNNPIMWIRYPAIWLVLGIPVGSLLWGQSS